MAASCDDGVIASQLGYEHAYGSADSSGRYRALDGVSVDDATLTLGAAVRLVPKSVQLGAALPLRLGHRRIRSIGSATALGVGDASLALRWTALGAGSGIFAPGGLFPSIDLIAGLAVPTGRPPEDSTEPTQADVTSDGSLKPSLGVKLTFQVTPLDSVYLRAQHTLRLPRDVKIGISTRRVDLGDETSVQLGYMRSLSMQWSAGALLDARFTGSARTDGVQATDADERRVRAGAWLSWMWHWPTWDSTLAVLADPFWSGVEKNIEYAGLSTTLSIRRVFH
ncbi:MAG: hypothetical protein IPI67_37060 [Myxococcales bacterium]|nr:hypothetical protein [Myxococcales bacterium]